MTLPVIGLAHLALRVTDLERAKKFYGEVLEFQPVQEAAGGVLFAAYGMLLGLLGDAPQTQAEDHFNPSRVGLDHLALAVPTEDQLTGLKQRLDHAQVRNNGIEDDPLTGARYISFYDPDGIAWEFYSNNPE